MVSFFKSFGKGILYILVLPVLLLILALYAVFALVGFIYLTIKSIILFFTGRSLFDDLPEDKKARAIIKANTINPDDYTPEEDMPYVEENKTVEPQRDLYSSNTPINEDPFYVPEYLKPNNNQVEETPEVEEEEDLVTPNDIAYNPNVEEKVQVEENEKEGTPSYEVEEENNANQHEDIPYIKRDYQVDINEAEDDDDDWDGDSSNLRL